LFLCPQQTSDFTMSNGKRIKENRLGFLFRLMSPRLHVSMYPRPHVFVSPCLHCLRVSMSPRFRNSQTENGTIRKWKLTFVLCKWKTETENFRLFVANGNGKRTIYLGRQIINGKRRLLFQQTCLSMVLVKCLGTTLPSLVFYLHL
jgi:hypothetical protein